jgi:hypothetical protein
MVFFFALAVGCAVAWWYISLPVLAALTLIVALVRRHRSDALHPKGRLIH